MARLSQLLRSYRVWAVVLACLVTAVVLWNLTAYPRGVVMAYADHARGHREVKTFGYPAPELREYTRLLRERYGVEVKAVAGCVVTYELMEYVRGYNAVSERLLNEKYERDIFAECWGEAEQRWRAEHPQETEK